MVVYQTPSLQNGRFMWSVIAPHGANNNTDIYILLV